MKRKKDKVIIYIDKLKKEINIIYSKEEAKLIHLYVDKIKLYILSQKVA